jgi:hypothetical protein
MAAQQDRTQLNFQTDSAPGVSNESSSKPVQREKAHPNRLYQPDSPAYEIPHAAPLSHPRHSSSMEHTFTQNQVQGSVLQQAPPAQLREISVHSQSARFTRLSPRSPVENILAQNEAQGDTLHQNSPTQPRGSSTHSKRARIPIPHQNSPVQDSPTQQSCSVESEEISILLRNSDPDIYLQFPNRVMNDNHVENRLGTIREEIKLYEEFMRGKIKDYTDAEVEEQLKGLEKVKPFVCIDDVEKEESAPFASQPSRIVNLWRSMLAVPPTARLRDELVRFDLEGLELPVVICSSLAYIILCVIFNDPDRLRVAERRAGFESVKRRKLSPSPVSKATLTICKSMARSMQRRASNIINYSSTETEASRESLRSLQEITQSTSTRYYIDSLICIRKTPPII